MKKIVAFMSLLVLAACEPYDGIEAKALCDGYGGKWMRIVAIEGRLKYDKTLIGANRKTTYDFCVISTKEFEIGPGRIINFLE